MTKIALIYGDILLSNIQEIASNNIFPVCIASCTLAIDDVSEGESVTESRESSLDTNPNKPVLLGWGMGVSDGHCYNTAYKTHQSRQPYNNM